jgi:hypothetical protein
MDQWRRDHPKDVETEVTLFATRKARSKEERAKNRRKKAIAEAQLAGPSTISDNDDRWLDLFITSDEGTSDYHEEAN